MEEGGVLISENDMVQRWSIHQDIEVLYFKHWVHCLKFSWWTPGSDHWISIPFNSGCFWKEAVKGKKGTPCGRVIYNLFYLFNQVYALCPFPSHFHFKAPDWDMTGGGGGLGGSVKTHHPVCFLDLSGSCLLPGLLCWTYTVDLYTQPSPTAPRLIVPSSFLKPSISLKRHPRIWSFWPSPQLSSLPHALQDAWLPP